MSLLQEEIMTPQRSQRPESGKPELGKEQEKRHSKSTAADTVDEAVRTQMALSRYAVEANLTPAQSASLLSQPASPDIRVQDMILSELQTARQLNIGFPDNPLDFIHLLEQRIGEITGTQKNVILILDEESGTYHCLNDDMYLDITHAPRELTWISDSYLQELLGSNQVIQSFLLEQGSVFGIIAVADKLDGQPFGLKDEILLEQLSQYVSVHINHYLTLKRALIQPRVQQILLNVSSKLLASVDTASICQATMDSLLVEMPFTAAQYVMLDRQTGEGQVIYQSTHHDGFTHGSPLRSVDGFASILSLFQSQVWHHPYLYLKGEALGDRRFDEMFGLEAVEAVILIPTRDAQNTITGALLLFQQFQQVGLTKQALSTLEEITQLMVAAWQRAQILEKALKLATTDELTECLNRRGFYSRFDAEVERARRNHSSLCLAMIDVDFFKRVNDTYGHLAGDEILQGLAKLLHLNIRKSDLICRFGGEEFAILLPETTIEQGIELMERLRTITEEHAFQTSAGPIPITFSGGISIIEPYKMDPNAESLQVISHALALADEALYDAKQDGRNRINLAQPK